MDFVAIDAHERAIRGLVEILDKTRADLRAALVRVVKLEQRVEELELTCCKRDNGDT